jgi:hypothetical protein
VANLSAKKDPAFRFGRQMLSLGVSKQIYRFLRAIRAPAQYDDNVAPLNG